LTEREKREWAFFLDENDEYSFADMCLDCDAECKQSFRTKVMYCPYYKKLTKERKKKAR
jgi:hypothetical protein